MKRQWWSQLTNYVLDQFSGKLERLGLYEAIRATCYGMEVSMPNFYVVLQLYCPSTRTFFSIVGGLGLALHEIWEWLYMYFAYLLLQLIEAKPAHKLQNMRFKNKKCASAQFFRYSKWLCGSWSTRRVCDGSFYSFIEIVKKKSEDSSLFLS